MKLKKRIWMNCFIRYILENYLVLIIAYMLEMQDLGMGSFSEGAQSVLAATVLITILACPLITWKFL